MRFPKALQRRTLVARAGTIVLIFVGFSLLWIPITDQILGWLTQDPVQLTRLATYKGGLYIIIVALFLFWLVVSALETTREERAEVAHPGGHELGVELRSLWGPLALFAAAALLLASLGVVIYKAERGQAELGEHLPVALQRLALIYGGVALLFLAVASIALFIWRRREEALVLADRLRIQAQNQLLEYRLEFLNQHANDIVLLVEPTGQIRYANDRAVEAYGYTQQQLQDLNLAELRAPETLQELPGQIATALEAGALRFETIHRRRDGSLFPVEVSSRSLVLEDTPCVESIIRDISERKQAEEALRESGERYYRLFDEAVEGIALADLEREVVLDCNQAFLKLVGREHQQVVGAALATFHRPAQLLEVREHLRAVLDGNLPATALTTRLLLDSGAEKEVELKLSRIELDGKWLALGFFRDLTEEHRREAERETTLHLLRLLNERSTTRELIGNLTRFIQEWSGCEAVGIRLREGEDFPYCETRGFPAEFVELERHLCARDPAGQLLRDEAGNPVLECMCGNILCRRFNPALPFFTVNGSFWSNCTTDLLASTTEEDRQARTRNRCNGEGYESVALIPLRSGDEVFGLLQLNDHAKGRFNPERIAFLEGVGDQIALALSKRQILAALEHSERRLRDLSEAAGEFLWETDARGNFSFISERITDILGYTPEELVGHNPYEFIELPEAGRLKALDSETRNFRNREVPLVSKSGRIVWASITRVMKTDDKGDVTGFFGAGLEITERKEAERELRESERKLTSLIGNLPGFVYRCANDESWTMEFISEGCRAVTGYGPEDFIGNRKLAFNDLIAKDHQEAIWRAWQQTLEIEESFEGEYPITTATGETRWVWERGSGIRDEAGRVLCLEGFITDITARKRAEAMLLQSEAQNQALINAIPDLLFTNKRDGEFLAIHAPDPSLLYVPPENFPHRKPEDVMPKPLADRFLKAFAAALDSGVVQELDYSLRVSGQDRHFEARVAPSTMDTVISIVRDITKRKQAEEALQANEAKLDLALRSAQMGVWVWDVRANKRHFDDRVCQLLGIDAGTFRGTQEEFLNVIEPEDRGIVTAAWAKTFEENLPYESEYHVRWQDGSVHSIHSRGRLTRDDRGQPLKVNGTLWDVTEQRLAASALKASEENYRRLFDTMKEGFALHEIITDDEGKAVDYRFLDVNPAFETMTGLPRERWLGRTVLELMPQTETHWIETYGRVALTGEPIRLEDYAASLGRWYQVFAFSPGARQFAVLTSDITERKQAELALQRSERFLQEAQRVGYVGCYSLDIASGEWESSESLDEIFGIGPAYPRDVQGWLELIVPESRAALSHHLETVILERSRFDYDYQIIRASAGEKRWVSGLGVLELDGQGQPIRMFGTIQDITERKDAEMVILRMTEELELRVKERTAQLEATNQELEAFSYSVSHDLRGPLRGIDGFSRALMEDYQDRLGAEGKHYLDRIRTGTQRMGQLIDDLLKLSRINRSDLDRLDVDLSSLCEKVLVELTRANPDRRIEVLVQPGLMVQADRRLLQGVLENLLGNAWKFTARSETARIEVRETSSPDGERVFCIRDNGAGFDMAYVDKLFNAFQRLHSAEDFEGTGIGLAIVQRIIHRHGGRVWAEAEIGKGAAFFFTLP